jgi:hypothetical protein
MCLTTINANQWLDFLSLNQCILCVTKSYYTELHRGIHRVKFSTFDSHY